MEFTSEIITAIKESREFTGYDKIDMLRELAITTKDKWFDIAADEIIERMDICPKCFADILFKPRSEIIGEYHGSPAREYSYEKICPKCGWKEDK